MNEFKNRVVELKKLHPSYRFVEGGDGTVLREMKKYCEDKEWIVGVRDCHQSFLSFQLNKKLDILEQDFQNYSYLEMDFEGKIELGVGDLILTGVPLLQLELVVGGKVLGSFRCNQLVISTWIGSSGANRSLGGPILLNGVKGMVIKFCGVQSGFAYSSVADSLVTEKDIELKIAKCQSYIDGASSEFKGGKIGVRLKQSKSFVYLPSHQERLTAAFIR